MEEAAIFGAGHYGRTAYAYYKEIYHITCFYDNDPMKWGKQWNEIPIRNPEELKMKERLIIIAVARQVDEIMWQLRRDYKITKMIFFSISEKQKEYGRYEDIDASIREQRAIFVVGDSHCIFWSGVEGLVSQATIRNELGTINIAKGPDKRFIGLHMGPALAYNVNKSGTNTKFLEKWERCIDRGVVVPGDAIVFSFGEIDIRCHVFKHVCQNKTYKDVVDDIIGHYMDFLIQVKGMGFRPYVWGPIGTPKDGWYIEHPDWPHAGNEVERNKATLYFNKRLKQECKTVGIGFIGIAEQLIDGDYRTRTEYILDECHLKQTARLLLNMEIDRVGLCLPIME